MLKNFTQEDVTVRTRQVAQVPRTRGFEVISSAGLAKAREFFKKAGINVYQKAILPKRGTKYSAAYDFFFNGDEPVEILPNTVFSFATNIKVYMLPDEFFFITIRSSVGMRYGLSISSTAAVIDSDYYENPSNEGNITISIRNNGTAPFILRPKERLAQGIFLQYLEADNCNTDVVRMGGMGSSGM